ncbi:MAG: hypothetical protein GY761_02930 [Hyphomicrobiales bacterium]|nr:hypothetical protein [Hyphomicrobiales bacterium]
MGELSAVETTVLAAIIGSLAAILAGFVSGLFTLMTPWMDHYFRRGRYRKLFVFELSDIIRHCEANVELMQRIQDANGIPARMHLEKMLVFETGMIFDNEMLSSMPVWLQRRFVGIRVAVRNVNLELTDTIARLFGDITPSKDEINQRFQYHLAKFRYLQERLESEVSEALGKPYQPHGGRSLDIIVIKPFKK